MSLKKNGVYDWTCDYNAKHSRRIADVSRIGVINRLHNYLSSNLFEINSCNCESDIFFFACAKVLASSPTVYLNKDSEEFEAILIASSIIAATSFGDGAFVIAG